MNCEYATILPGGFNERCTLQSSSPFCNSEMKTCDIYAIEKANKMGFNSLSELLSAYEQVKAERDAAIEMMRGDCDYCRTDYGMYKKICLNCFSSEAYKSNWEWRGLTGGEEDGTSDEETADRPMQ